eukprot:scaffold310712_cov18-Prasinocladus_malaysianus.AAC.1
MSDLLACSTDWCVVAYCHDELPKRAVPSQPYELLKSVKAEPIDAKLEVCSLHSRQPSANPSHINKSDGMIRLINCRQ